MRNRLLMMLKNSWKLIVTEITHGRHLIRDIEVEERQVHILGFFDWSENPHEYLFWDLMDGLTKQIVNEGDVYLAEPNENDVRARVGWSQNFLDLIKPKEFKF